MMTAKHSTSAPVRALRTMLLFVLVGVLSVSCIPGAFALTGDATAHKPLTSAAGSTASDAEAEKTEVVYATLAANGAAQAVYVVNRFDVKTAGHLVDYGDYSQVKNLTTTDELTRSGDTTSVEVDAGAFAYQGDLARAVLPWDVAISYELDGHPISADELAGKSGDVAVRVKTTRNEAVNPAFAESFMMQITFTLDENLFSDIVAEGATVASAGQSRTVAFTVLPGHDADLVLEATAKDFSMAGIQFAALPYSSVIEMPDTSEMTDGMNQLADAVSQLNSGVSEFSAGVGQLGDGASQLAAGSAQFGEGLAKLDANSEKLVAASAQINDALGEASAGLANADLSDLDRIGELPGLIRQVAEPLAALAGGLAQAQVGLANAHDALGTAVAEIPAAPTKAQIDALRTEVAGTDHEATVDALAASSDAAQKVKAIYAQVDPAFDAADSSMLQAATALTVQAQTLAGAADQLEALLDKTDVAAQIQGLVDGLVKLGSEYGKFHEGLAEYAGGVTALNANYHDIDTGISSFAGGAGQLAGGFGELAGGVSALDASTSELPQLMRERMDEAMADYDFPEFDPVSFVSPENNNVAAVQFIMTSAAIEVPAPEPAAEEPAPEKGIWERFLDLFTG